MPPTEAEPQRVVVRRAARIIVIDAHRRVLVFAARDPADGRLVWFLPGGGIEPGETIEQAARRELAEEVGLVEPLELSGPVWTRHHDFSWNGDAISQDEWIFVHRLEQPVDAATIGPSTAEAVFFEGARWATVADLTDWPHVMAPRRLAELLPPLLAGELPDAPIDAGA